MKYFLECVNCGRRFNSDSTLYLCPDCSKNNDKSSPPAGVLKAVYDYDSVKKTCKNYQEFLESRFLDLLPIDSIENLSFLNVGNTPLYRFKIDVKGKQKHSLLLKDDSQNPTYSYKDRASDIVCAYAKERGISTIVAASTGNAGSSLAGIGASQDQKIIILVPENAPVAKLTQAILYGAIVIPVKGDYDQAFDLSVELTEELNIFNRNTAYNPFTIEGKKTASFEIYQQMEQNVPDRIFIPAGDGVILSGIYKGWEDLKNAGYLERIPEIVAVQAAGSANIISNLNDSKFEFPDPHTIADSISVKIPRNFYMAKDFLIKYGGKGISVSDDEIIDSAKTLAKNYGLFAEPASAAAYAGYLKFLENGFIEDDSSNVVILTGSGLKDTAAYKNELNKIESKGKSEILDYVKKILRL